MHIRYALRDDATKSQDTPIYPASITSLSVANSSQGGNSLLNFGMALGGILLVTIITGIIAYIYRRKISCNTASQETSKGSSGRISCIMECYSNDYVINPNNSYITKKYDNLNFVNINRPSDDNPTKVKSDERNTMKSIFSSIYNKSIKRPNTIMNHHRNTSKSNKSLINDEKKSRPHTIEYSIPQISSPIPMPSASIFDTERATSLAANLSRSTTLNVSSHPLPPLPPQLPTIDKEPKETVRNSRNSGDSRDSRDSKTKSITNFNSLYNLIPLMFKDSDATTVETVLNDNRSHNNSNNNNNNNNNDDTIDLIRFSINSGDNGQSSRYRPNQQLIIHESTESYETESHETESHETELHDDITKEDFLKELERNIERNPEKYNFLKNPVQNPDNWKRNGNFFEYRLQRSRTVI